MADSETGCCRAEKISILHVTGADARSFLHAQLTQDLRPTEQGAGTAAAWLDPQGRVRACFDVVQTPSGFDLLGPAALAENLVARLRMFVLRADVAVTRAADSACFALVGDTQDWPEFAGIAPGPAPFSHRSIDATDWLRIGPDLIYAWGAEAALQRLFASLPPANDGASELAEIRLGRPQVESATASRFIPQMLNLDRLAAIAWDKGCYPGQEIVARTQNLGTVKRRMFRYLTTQTEPPPAGTALVDPAGREVGTVIRGAPAPAGSELLAVVQADAAEMRLLPANSRSLLQRADLPYEQSSQNRSPT